MINNSAIGCSTGCSLSLKFGKPIYFFHVTPDLQQGSNHNALKATDVENRGQISHSLPPPPPPLKFMGGASAMSD